MSEKQRPLIFERSYDLSTVRVFEVDFPIASYAVKSFDGTAGTVLLRATRGANDPNPMVIASGAADSWRDAGKMYIANTVAQSGKTLVMKWGGDGTTVTVPTSSSGGDASQAYQALIEVAVDAVAAAVAAAETDIETVAARLANQAAVAFRQITVGTNETQLSTLTIPHGHRVHIQALKGNDEDNPIKLHLTTEGGGTSIYD